MRLLLVIAAALTIVAAASAGYGRFNPTGQIVGNGHNAKVSGPFTLDSDEAGAVVTATITQGNTTATGTSSYLTGSSWSATVHTNGTLHNGTATAYGVATIYYKDGGTEQYPWSDSVTLSN